MLPSPKPMSYILDYFYGNSWTSRYQFLYRLEQARLCCNGRQGQNLSDFKQERLVSHSYHLLITAGCSICSTCLNSRTQALRTPPPGTLRTSLAWGKWIMEGAVLTLKWVVLRSDCTLLFITCWLELVMKPEGRKEGEKEVRTYLEAENRKYLGVNTDSYHNSITVEVLRATQFMPLSKQLSYSFFFFF